MCELNTLAFSRSDCNREGGTRVGGRIAATPPQNKALKPTTAYFRTIPKQKQATDRIGIVPSLIADGSFPAKNFMFCLLDAALRLNLRVKFYL